MAVTITPWGLRLQAAPPVPRVHHPRQHRRPRRRRGQRQVVRRLACRSRRVFGTVFTKTYVREFFAAYRAQATVISETMMSDSQAAQARLLSARFLA